jgi:hypothetical protein
LVDPFNGPCLVVLCPHAAVARGVRVIEKIDVFVVVAAVLLGGGALLLPALVLLRPRGVIVGASSALILAVCLMLFAAVGVWTYLDAEYQRGWPERRFSLLIVVGYALVLAGAFYRSAYLEWAADRRSRMTAHRQEAHPYGFMAGPDEQSLRQS